MTPINARALEKMIGISLTDNEAEELQSQLTTILAYVEKIREFSCDAHEQFADVQEIDAIIHEDIISDSVCAKDIIAGVPLKERTYVAVPKYIGDRV